MPRPRHCCYVEGKPQADYYKPRGVPMSALEEVQLSVEGLEAIRLADMEGLSSTDAAERMRISRFTFGRVLAAARKAVAEGLTMGKAIHIKGGHYEVLPQDGPVESYEFQTGVQSAFQHDGQGAGSGCGKGCRSPKSAEPAKLAEPEKDGQ